MQSIDTGNTPFSEYFQNIDHVMDSRGKYTKDLVINLETIQNISQIQIL